MSIFKNVKAINLTTEILNILTPRKTLLKDVHTENYSLEATEKGQTEFLSFVGLVFFKPDGLYMIVGVILN